MVEIRDETWGRRSAVFFFRFTCCGQHSFLIFRLLNVNQFCNLLQTFLFACIGTGCPGVDERVGWKEMLVTSSFVWISGKPRRYIRIVQPTRKWRKERKENVNKFDWKMQHVVSTGSLVGKIMGNLEKQGYSNPADCNPHSCPSSYLLQITVERRWVLPPRPCPCSIFDPWVEAEVITSY